MRQVLIVYYSQSGQLNQLVESVSAPLREESNLQVDYLQLRMQTPFPFPWPFLKFFRIFPETVLMQPQPLQPLAIDADKKYDLIILAYQVWFLSPSLPMTSFLATPEAAKLLNGAAVMTLIGCRNMWLIAQEKMKEKLQQLNAHLIDNVVLTDACGSAMSFISTPLWMFTGRKKAYSWVPQAGIAATEITAARRFGEAISARLLQNSAESNGMQEWLQAETAPALCLIKPWLGHTLGACGLSETLLLIECLKNQHVPVMLDSQNCSLPLRQNPRWSQQQTRVLANFFGFGGNNASIIFETGELSCK